MKKIHFLFLLLFSLSFWACTNEFIERDLSIPTTINCTHKIPIEKALSELNSMLEVIDKDIITRSGTKRQVSTVKTVKLADIGLVTRSNKILDAEELIYIANFENGEGYAILGADDRLASIIAVTEMGSLAQEDFIDIVHRGYNLTDGPPVLSFVANYALGDGDRPIGGIDGGRPPADLNVISYGDWKFDMKLGPLVPTKWNQTDPYNFYKPKSYAGCVAVALAQYITAECYRKRRYSKVRARFPKIADETIDWTTIIASISSGERSYPLGKYTEESKAVAWLIRQCGIHVRTSYGSIEAGTGSSASMSNIAYYLSTFGFKNAMHYGYNAKDVVMYLEINKLPLLVSGYSSTPGGKVGHAWLIDGECKQTRIIEQRFTDIVIDSWTESRTLIHANFGWGGSCDGYYYPGVFDLREGSQDIEKNFGDKNQNMNSNYSRMEDLIYSLGL